MLGKAISSHALGDAVRRELASEQAGPRPGAVREDAAARAASERRTVVATKP